MSLLPIDLEAERIQLDGAWLTRDDLSNRITQMISAKDYRISKLSDALEQLAQAITGARAISFKLTAEQYAKIDAAGQKLGKTADAFARDLLMQVLTSPAAAQAPAAAPPAILPAPPPAPVIAAPPVSTAPDVTPEEAAAALTITPKRREPVPAAPPPPVMSPVAPATITPVGTAPVAPAPSVVVDLGAGAGEDGKGKAGDNRRWFNRTP